MTFRRRTPKTAVRFEGLGLHSGVPVGLTIHPGRDGIAFRAGTERVPAVPSNVSDTTRCTRLGSISTIEHLMSAFAALEITDAEVELSAPELPAVDGSAAPYHRTLQEAGFEDLGERTIGDLFSRLFLQETKGRKIAVSKGEGHWRYVFDVGARWPGLQAYEGCLASYETEIAPARTIVLSEEIESAQQAGLGRGLDESSVLVLESNGYRNEPRFADEPARHKLLDLIGDLYLSGVPVAMLNVVAERTGHRSNVEMARMLFDATHTG
jgi:UDP-3-O-[3-hydroxymyristoyl] N-acetylglucosamine deacetylase